MLIDSHTNLHGETFAEDLPDVLDRARSAGVRGMIAICCRLADFEAVSAIAEAHDDIWCTIGAHPHHAKDRPDICADELIEIASHPKVIGIGETGLDFHYGYSPREEQFQSLRAHIDAARRTDLPLILHTREADAEMADLLEEEMGRGAFRALLHCYTGGPELARRGAALGAYFAASGIITFKKAEDVRRVFRDHVPVDRLIIETDCPYLAPMPHRGRRNEPSFLPDVLAGVCETLGWTKEEGETRTTEAFFRLFSKVERPL
ncbi:TatD family hydrolase [Hyphobacterium sp. CCMP332]|uniref:TatD family hydrolase n=1 Tax=Hyphobacterium sp. CCMP332 TaxID=2749086 RepID=UPI00164EE2AB|nr:TatD family hydrolase [Hyphobacterium sp. CCMP332]QNL18720.1 TatD family hydrolase [Hyphobacterium sp. CCMP332]